MTNVWCVRAEFGTYAKQFVDCGYVAIGWMPNSDLSSIKARDELYPLYKSEHPDDTSNIVIGQQVGQIARFLLEIQPGDYVITPAARARSSPRPTTRAPRQTWRLRRASRASARSMTGSSWICSSNIGATFRPSSASGWG